MGTLRAWLRREDPYEGVVDPGNALYRIYTEAAGGRRSFADYTRAATRDARPLVPMLVGLGVFFAQRGGLISFPTAMVLAGIIGLGVYFAILRKRQGTGKRRQWHEKTFWEIIHRRREPGSTAADLWACGVNGRELLEALCLERRDFRSRFGWIDPVLNLLIAAVMYTALRGVAGDSELLHWRVLIAGLPACLLSYVLYLSSQMADARMVHIRWIGEERTIAEKAAAGARSLARIVILLCMLLLVCAVLAVLIGLVVIGWGDIVARVPLGVRQLVHTAGWELLVGGGFLTISFLKLHALGASTDAMRDRLRAALEEASPGFDTCMRREVLGDGDA